MLLTFGRIGPAFDSNVRSAFQLPRITDARGLLEVYSAISEDLRRSEEMHSTTLESCVPKDCRRVGIGRIVDMVAGPRGPMSESANHDSFAELRAEMEKLHADRQ